MKPLLAAAFTVLTVALAPTANATPAQDRELFDVMAATGLYLYPVAVDNAYVTCDYVWRGPGREVAIVDLGVANPEWTQEQLRTFVDAAVRIYCPNPPPPVQLPTSVGDDKARQKIV